MMIQARTSSVPTVLSRQITERRAYICCWQGVEVAAHKRPADLEPCMQPMSKRCKAPIASRRVACDACHLYIIFWNIRFGLRTASLSTLGVTGRRFNG